MAFPAGFAVDPVGSAQQPLQRLLVVEDDETIRETIGESLQLEGFEVVTAASGLEARSLLGAAEAAAGFDLLVLDLMLPGLGGLDLCRELRQARDPLLILVVSARDSETDRVLGLELGADDYLVKPFGMRELVARCRALLRRSHAQAAAAKAAAASTEPVLRQGDLELFPRQCLVLQAGLPLNLAPKEYRLLELFMAHPRRVWSREQLIEKIWGVDYFGDAKTVDVHIRWLREKIEAEPSRPQLLVTVRGFGYRFG